MGYAASIAWVLFFLILVATVLQMKLARRWVYYEAGEQ
jgi:multiple sugar transport system permease protein